MAKKRTNRNQRHLYSTPLPLPGLVQDASPQPATAPTAVKEAVYCKGWTSIESLVQLFRGMVNQVTRGCDAKREKSISGTKTISMLSNQPRSVILARAEFHPQGEAVWISDPEDMQRIFRQGFFGKGTLSRSEASWKSRQLEKVQGAVSPNLSLEDITRKRRIERAALKEEKRLAGASGSAQASGASSPAATPPPATTVSSPSSAVSPISSSISGSPMLTSSSVSLSNLDIDSFEDMEHLQLSLEEAFFLVFAIEAIAVYTSLSTSSDKGADPPMTIRECWSRFAMASSAKDRHIAFKDSVPCGWENPFTIRYVAYHHFRSHGWVVKDGLKYGVDFLLYRKGVVFGHSEYAVKVVQGSPGSTAEESHSLSSPPLLLSPRPILGKVDPWHHPVYSWQYLLNISRVVSQVQKTLLLCHVIPPQDSSSLPDHILLDPRLALPQYTVVEVTSRRWIPERHRA